MFLLVNDLRGYLELLKEKGWIDVITEPRSLESLAASMKEQEKKNARSFLKTLKVMIAPW